jgi:DNA-binding protein HU-beta
MFKALIATIEDCLVSGDKVQIVGFGSLEVKERAARTGRDMMTGKTVTIDPRRTVVFRPGNQLKQLVNTNNQL